MILQDVMTMPREDLAKLKSPHDFWVDPDTMGKDQRLSIYTPPIPGHLYVAGGDFAYGIEGRDFDTLVILDKATKPVEQVAELEGRWGADRFDRLVYCMLRFYFNAFMVGERQVGLPVLRSLLNNFGYGYLYYNRNEASKGRRRQDCLGHHKSAGDPTIASLRKALRDDLVRVRSERSIQQLRAYQFRPKGKLKEKTEDMRDADLTMGAPPGEFDDLVTGWAMGWKGIEEVHFFEEDRPQFEEDKAGGILGMADVMRKEPKHQPRTVFRGYGK